jgi:hypothetical protein
LLANVPMLEATALVCKGSLFVWSIHANECKYMQIYAYVSGVCFNCGSSGHIARECLKQDVDEDDCSEYTNKCSSDLMHMHLSKYFIY